MQFALCSGPMIGCRAIPVRAARRSPGLPAGTSRNPVADRPRDFSGGLRPAVRSVQHLNLQSSEETFGQPAPFVTLRSPGKRQCTTSIPLC